MRCALPDGLLRVRIAPLRDVVVLHALDPESVEIALARQRLNIRDVVRSELRRELDDDPPGRQVHVERVLRIDRPPVGRSRGGQHFRGRQRLLGRLPGRSAVRRRRRGLPLRAVAISGQPTASTGSAAILSAQLLHTPIARSRRHPTALIAWISSAPAFCASPYSMRVLSR